MPKQPTNGGLAGGGTYKPPEPKTEDAGTVDNANSAVSNDANSVPVQAETSPLSEKISTNNNGGSSGPTSDDLNWVREQLKKQDGIDDNVIDNEALVDIVDPPRTGDFLQHGKEYHVQATVEGDAPPGEDYSNLENEPGMRSTDIEPIVDDVEAPEPVATPSRTVPRDTSHSTSHPATTNYDVSSSTNDYANVDLSNSPEYAYNDYEDDYGEAGDVPYDMDESTPAEPIENEPQTIPDANDEFDGLDDVSDESFDDVAENDIDAEPSDLERMADNAAAQSLDDDSHEYSDDYDGEEPLYDNSTANTDSANSNDGSVIDDVDSTPDVAQSDDGSKDAPAGTSEDIASDDVHNNASNAHEPTKEGLAEQAAPESSPTTVTNKDTSALSSGGDAKGVAPKKDDSTKKTPDKTMPSTKHGEQSKPGAPSDGKNKPGAPGAPGKDKPGIPKSDNASKSGIKNLADKASNTLGGKGAKAPSAPSGKKGLASDTKQTADNIKKASDLVGKAAKVAKHIPAAAPAAAIAEKAAQAVNKNADNIAKGATAAKKAGNALKNPQSGKAGALKDKDKDSKEKAKEKAKKARMRRIRRMLIMQVLPIVLIILLIFSGIAGCSALIGGFGSSKSETIESDSGVFIPSVNVSDPENEGKDDDKSSSSTPFDGEWCYYNQLKNNWNWDTSKDGGVPWGKGCGVVSFAMICTSYSKNADYTPSYMAINNISDGCAIVEDKFVNFINDHSSEMGLKASSSNKGTNDGWKDNWDKVVDICNAGGCVLTGVGQPIASSAFNSHYIVVRKVENGTVTYADPAGGCEKTYSESDFKSLPYTSFHTTTIWCERT